MSSTTLPPTPAPTSSFKALQLHLPSVFHFEGWEIRYRLTGSSTGEGSSGAATGTAAAAEALVFVHGTPWSSAVYGPVIEALQTKSASKGEQAGEAVRTILVYDLPGYGQSQVFLSSRRALQATSAEASEERESGTLSSPPPVFAGDTSVRFQARALAALLSHTKLHGSPGSPPPQCIAHDIAGTIVLRAHLLEGCSFSRLLLVDTNTVLPWGDGFYKLVRSKSGPFMRLPPTIFEAMLRAVIRSACYRGEVLGGGGGKEEGGWEDVLAQPWLPHPDSDKAPSQSQDGQHSFVRQIAQANDADVAELLSLAGGYSNVRCDVTVLWGEEDQWIPRDKIETLIDMLGERCKRTVFVPRAGHLLMLDQPEVFEREVLEWLELA